MFQKAVNMLKSVRKILDSNIVFDLCVLLLIIFTVIVTFDGIRSLYFLQDEWMGIGRLQSLGLKKIWTPDGGNHVLIISSLFFYIEYLFFGMNQMGYIYTALILHTISSFFVYKLYSKIFINKIVGVLSAIIFASSFISHQTVSWFGVSHSTILSTIFATGSIYLFWNYLNSQKHKTSNLNFSILMLLASVFSKEDTISLLLFYPLAAYIYDRKYILPTIKRCIVFGITYLFFRFFILGKINPSLGYDNGDHIISILKNTILFPLMGFSQLFVPNNILQSLGNWFFETVSTRTLKGVPSGEIEIFYSTIYFNWITIFMSFFLMLLFLYFLVFRKTSKNQFALKILFFMNIISFFPFALVYGTQGLESRHFYFPRVIAVGTIAFLLSLFWKKSKSLFAKFIIVSGLLINLINNINLVQAYTSKLSEISYPRIKAVSEILSHYHNLPSKTVFFITADYGYWMAENTLPFQQGSGYTLMVLFNKNNIYSKLLDENCLWDFGSQGYCEEGHVGFGFYSDENMLRDDYAKYGLVKENIYSAHWVNKEMRLVDTTDEFRESFETKLK